MTNIRISGLKPEHQYLLPDMQQAAELASRKFFDEWCRKMMYGLHIEDEVMHYMPRTAFQKIESTRFSRHYDSGYFRPSAQLIRDRSYFLDCMFKAMGITRIKTIDPLPTYITGNGRLGSIHRGHCTGKSLTNATLGVYYNLFEVIVVRVERDPKYELYYVRSKRAVAQKRDLENTKNE